MKREALLAALDEELRFQMGGAPGAWIEPLTHAFAAIEARGLAVVPVVATEGMKQAAADAWHNAKDDPALCPLGPGESSAFFYAAMLSASKDDPNV